MYDILARSISIRTVAWIVILVLSVHTWSPETSINLGGEKKKAGCVYFDTFQSGK